MSELKTGSGGGVESRTNRTCVRVWCWQQQQHKAKAGGGSGIDSEDPYI